MITKMPSSLFCMRAKNTDRVGAKQNVRFISSVLSFPSRRGSGFTFEVQQLVNKKSQLEFGSRGTF